MQDAIQSPDNSFERLVELLKEGKDYEAIDLLNNSLTSREDHFANTALEFAAKFGRMIVLKYLVEEKEVGVTYTHISVATRNSQLEVFNYLLVRVKLFKDDHEDLILIAVRSANLAFIEVLIVHPKFSNERILYHARKLERQDIIEKLQFVDGTSLDDTLSVTEH